MQLKTFYKKILSKRIILFYIYYLRSLLEWRNQRL